MTNKEYTKEELKELIRQLSQFSAATVHEALGRIGSVDHEIKPITRGMKVCGPAVTVGNHVGDNVMLHKAIISAQEGDVIVAATGSYKQAGAWGDIMSTACMARGIAGFATDGGVRDIADITRMGFSVFSRSVCINGTVKATLGTLNEPISFGGVVVNPGDIILGDDDGVVVIPRNRLEEAVKKSAEREEKEEVMRQNLKSGMNTVEMLGLSKLLNM